MAHPFERLHAWQVSHRLALQVYRTSARFPKEERYGLTAQIRRAAGSTPANIAEGSCVGSKREFARYLTIARKSNNEVAYWIRMARDLEYTLPEEWKVIDEGTHHAGIVIWALEQRLRGE